MTLILSFASTNKVIQVSDRRLTLPDGSLYDDNANKAICVSCLDSHFAIGYCGLGTISRNKRTDEWLVDYLASINAEHLTLTSIINKICLHSSQTLKGLQCANQYKALTFVLAGYSSVPFIAQISNFENQKMESLKEVEDVFHSTVVSIKTDSNPKTACIFTIHGTEKAVTKSLFQRLIKQRRRLIAKESKLVVEDFVSTIRGASRTTTFGNYVGRNCMAVIINPRNSDPSFEEHYFSDQESSQIFSSHVILPGVAFKDIVIWTGEDTPPWWK